MFAVGTVTHHVAPWRSVYKVDQLLPGEIAFALQTAIVDQTSFMAGYQQAVADWQQATAQALRQVRNAMPWHTTLREAMNAWGIAADAQATTRQSNAF